MGSGRTCDGMGAEVRRKYFFSRVWHVPTTGPALGSGEGDLLYEDLYPPSNRRWRFSSAFWNLLEFLRVLSSWRGCCRLSKRSLGWKVTRSSNPLVLLVVRQGGFEPDCSSISWDFLFFDITAPGLARLFLPMYMFTDSCRHAAALCARSCRIISWGRGRLSQSIVWSVLLSVAAEMVCLSLSSISGRGISGIRLLGSNDRWT